MHTHILGASIDFKHVAATLKPAVKENRPAVKRPKDPDPHVPPQQQQTLKNVWWASRGPSQPGS